MSPRLFVITLASIVATGTLLSSVHGALDPLDYFPEAAADNNLATPYHNWVLSEQSSVYDRHVFLPKALNANEGAAIFWKIHNDNNDGGEPAVSRIFQGSSNNPWIQFAVAVQATEWVGFGLSEAGGMLGADMAIFEVATPDTIRDAYVVEERYPQTDDCQHWELLNVTIDEGWIIVEMARELDTGDPQDHPIVDDSSSYLVGNRLIAAWGSETFGYHGPNVARSTVKLFTTNQGLAGTTVESTRARLEELSDGSIEIRENNFTIPVQETTYQPVCYNYTDLLAQSGLEEGQSVTLIGAVPLITPETEAFVHHFVVYSSTEPTGCDYGGVLTAWAPGETGMYLPENVGIPLFGEGQVKSIIIEIHYNNPDQTPNLIDSSGISVFFSFEPREHEAAFLQLGDPFLQLLGEPINEGLSEWSFECPSSCSSLVLGNESVTVIEESLHMHKTGARMVNEVIRGDKVAHTGTVDVFDFDQQGSFRVPTEPYQINPGDAFRTTCYYRDGTTFGMSSQEEMCIAFLLYYPAKKMSFGARSFPWVCPYGLPLARCSQELSSRKLPEEEQLARGFGSSLDSCEAAEQADGPDSDPPSDNVGGEEGSSGISTSKGSFAGALVLGMFLLLSNGSYFISIG